jgi:hypothetical protein
MLQRERNARTIGLTLVGLDLLTIVAVAVVNPVPTDSTDGLIALVDLCTRADLRSNPAQAEAADDAVAVTVVRPRGIGGARECVRAVRNANNVDTAA